LAIDAKELDETYEERAIALGRCLEQIHARSREAVRLRYAEQLAVKEVAARMHRTANAVSQLLFRARQWLIACVKREDDVQAAT
jgi:RNA polymerase sigma factor (sigma-70 family)